MFNGNLRLQDAQQLQGIYWHLDAVKAGMPVPAERRQRKRIRFPKVAQFDLFTLPDAHPHKAFVRDISTSGIGFLAKRAFKPADLFVMPFQLPGWPDAKIILCRVTFARYAAKAMYEAGACFERVKSATSAGPHVPFQVPPEWLRPLDPPQA